MSNPSIQSRAPLAADWLVGGGEMGALIRAPGSQIPAIASTKLDDNQDAADSLCLLLKLLGAEAQAAHDGTRALQIFQELHPRMVLLDIGMPGMDGYELARRLRELPQWSQGPRPLLVAVTGWGQSADRRRVRDAGFDHHIVKPAELDALKVLVDRVEGP